MRVVAWNLGHRTVAKEIPDGLGDLFAALGADVVLLNEYVDSDTRGSFLRALEAAGYLHLLVSETRGRHNQILAAARSPFRGGDLAPPTLTGSAEAGFLHIQFEDSPIELVGFRAPAYKKPERHAYWDQMIAVMRHASSRPVAFTGDINLDPFKKDPGASSVPFPGCDLYEVPNPSGAWSFTKPDGTGPSRIDHVLHTAAVEVTVPTYVTRLNDWVLAGPTESSPISDHAALAFNVTARAPVPAG